MPPDAPQETLKAAHRALVRRHHPDILPAAKRPEATRLIQEINVAYGLVRDPARRADYDRLRRRMGPDYDAAVVAAGHWAGRWWARNRTATARSAARARMTAARGQTVGRRVVTEALGRVLWLLLCVLGAIAGFLLAAGAQRLVGVAGPWTQLAGIAGGLALGNQRGWHLRHRLAGLPRPPGAPALVALAAVVATSVGLWLDSL